MRTRLIAMALLTLFVASPAWAINSTQDASDFDLTDGICDADPGPATVCTLRAEIEQFNATGPWAGTLTVPQGNYVLTLGEIPIDRSLRLEGTGAVLIDARGNSRIFHVRQGAAFVRFTNLRMTDGAAQQGGAILVDAAMVDVVGCSFERNRAAADGGAIYAAEDLLVDDSRFIGNFAQGNGGAVAYGGLGTILGYGNTEFEANQAQGHGGAVYMPVPRPAVAIIEECTFTSNVAGRDGGAFWGGRSQILASTFESNQSRGHGGAIESVGSRTFVGGSTIRDNTAAGDGGGLRGFALLTLDDTLLTGNDAGGGGGGASLGDTAFVVRSTFDDNTAGRLGGGLLVRGDATVERTTLSWNDGSDGGGAAFLWGTVDLDGVTAISNITNGSFGTGGGLYFAYVQASLNRVSVVENSARRGGGIGIDHILEIKGQKTEATLVELENCTLARNQSGNQGGGALVRGRALLQAFATTIAYNNSGRGGGVATDFGAKVELRDALVSLNPGGDCSGDVTSLGYSLLTQTAGCSYTSSWANGDLTGSTAFLGPYPSNLSATPGDITVPLTAASPAIDRGGPNCPVRDQRGSVRFGNGCEIGAREFIAEPRTRTKR